MAKKEYWKSSFKQLENAQHSMSLEKAMQIQEQFDKSLSVIERQIDMWYARLAVNNNVSMTEAKRMLSAKELKEFRWSVEEYIKYGKDNGIEGKWAKELENASARVHINRLESLKYQIQAEAEKLYGNYLDDMDRHIADMYNHGYYHTAFEIQRGMGVGSSFRQLDTRMVEQVIHNPWAADGRNFSDRIWTDKTKLINTLYNEITLMVITGDGPDRAIKKIQKEMMTSRRNATRIVMTESAAFATQARNDCMKELGVQEYEVVETLDSHTCPTCQDMDGTHYPMSEHVIGVTAPPFHPSCRGCTCPYFRDEFTEGEQRAARNEDGKTYYVPSDMTYKEWKKSFVGGQTENLTAVSSDATINMGAVSGALNPNSARASKHAVRYYKLVRKMSTDCEAISKKTGYPLSFVQDIKNHLFMTKHDLGNDTLEYFFPDYEIAQSWQRLMDSKMKIQPHDLILLEHEHAEYLYMQKGMTQKQAHQEAEKRYNYAKALKERK